MWIHPSAWPAGCLTQVWGRENSIPQRQVKKPTKKTPTCMTIHWWRSLREWCERWPGVSIRGCLPQIVCPGSSEPTIKQRLFVPSRSQEQWRKKNWNWAHHHQFEQGTDAGSQERHPPLWHFLRRRPRLSESTFRNSWNGRVFHNFHNSKIFEFPRLTLYLGVEPDCGIQQGFNIILTPHERDPQTGILSSHYNDPSQVEPIRREQVSVLDPKTSWATCNQVAPFT